MPRTWSGFARSSRATRGEREHVDADVLVWFEACRIATRTAIECEAWAAPPQWVTP